MKISAVVLTKNEEENTVRCLKSLDFVDEIIVVDDFSSDSTLKIIQNSKLKIKNYNSKLKIFQRRLGGNFSEQRNFGMEKAEGEWILFVDADEEVSKELQSEIVTLLHGSVNEETQCFYLKRREFFWGREVRYGEVRKVREKGLVRLVRKNSGRWIGKVHEEIEASGMAKTLENYLFHYPHQSLKEFLEEVNFYSSLRAKELRENSVSASLFSIIAFPLGKFFLTYFVKMGFLDGAAGFVYSFLMSFHSFLVRVKLFI